MALVGPMGPVGAKGPNGPQGHPLLHVPRGPYGAHGGPRAHCVQAGTQTMYKKSYVLNTRVYGWFVGGFSCLGVVFLLSGA